MFVVAVVFFINSYLELMMENLSLRRLVAVAMLVTGAVSAHAQSITNGSLAGGKIPTGWTALTPTGESWVNFATSPVAGNAWGIQYLDGWGGRYNKGGLSQSISGLTIGETYYVTFYQEVAHTPAPGVTSDWLVSFGEQTLNSTLMDNGTPGTWYEQVLEFTATAATQTLTFAAKWNNATPGATPTILNLAGVTLTAAPVPEPSTVAFAMLGLATVGCLVRRRTVAKKTV